MRNGDCTSFSVFNFHMHSGSSSMTYDVCAFHIVIVSYLACLIYRAFFELCVAKPGQTGHKLQVFAACPIHKLRRKVIQMYNVERECQLLVYKGQVLVDEHPENKRGMKVEDYIIGGDHTSTCQGRNNSSFYYLWTILS